MSDAGFNGVTVWSGGGYHIKAAWDPAQYERKSDSSDWWTGAAWAGNTLGDGLGGDGPSGRRDPPARHGLTSASCAGFDTTGAGPNGSRRPLQMHDVGVAVATRYPKAPTRTSCGISCWMTPIHHSTRGQRIRSLFDGINDTEGGTTRPVRWMEPANGATTNSQGWFNETDTKITIN